MNDAEDHGSKGKKVDLRDDNRPSAVTAVLPGHLTAT